MSCKVDSAFLPDAGTPDARARDQTDGQQLLSVAVETEARGNLDAWAAAGGTHAAFIVDPTQDVAAQSLDALDKIRSGSIACQYRLPLSPAGSKLDLDKVNVALIEASNSRDFFYVGDASQCARTALGWHYDAEPSTGKATKIVVCAAACDTLKAADGGRVEVRVGCETKGG